MTETRYQHSFTSPSPWCKPTDATRRRWSAGSGGRLPAAGVPARRGGRALGVDGDGVAAVGLVEPLRVANAMPCPQGVVGNVAPKHPKWRSPPPVAVTACATGATSVGAAAGDGEVVGAFQPRDESA